MFTSLPESLSFVGEVCRDIIDRRVFSSGEIAKRILAEDKK